MDRVTLPSLLAAFGLAWIVAAQPPKDATSLAGQVELARLVDLAAERLHLRVQYDPAALKAAGSVTLRLDSGLGDSELWALTNRVLAERGLTTVQIPGGLGYSVLKVADAAGKADVFAEHDAGPKPGFRVAVARAKHRPAKELVDAASKVLSKPGGMAQAVGESGLILIADLSSGVDQALSLLELIDVPGPEAVVEEIPVRNLTAQSLAVLVMQVSAKRELVSGEKMPGECLVSAAGNSVLVVASKPRLAYWKDLVARLDQRERVEAATYTPRAFGVREVGRLVEETIKDQPGSPADDRWRLVADELTGMLIVTATPSQHEQIRALIERLDSAPMAAQRPVRSFIIKNRPVKEIQEILERMASGGLIGAPSEELGKATTTAAPQPPAGTAPWPPANSPNSSAQTLPASTSIAPAAPKYRGPKGTASDAPISFTADDGSNTLIAMGEPRTLAQVEALLATLDVRQPQVMLEVLIVSLSESQTLDLGVELEKQTTIGDTRIRLASLFGLGSRGTGGDRTVGDGAGFTGLVLSPGDFSVVLRALQTINKGRSLSMPRLLAANNQSATLDSVLSQPYASTNASNTVTTTSYGGVQDAGTQVTLKPQIGAGDHLNLDYSVSLSAFVGAPSSANLPPPKQQNKVQSAASLPDGYTVAVGGIEHASEGQGTSQVPGLGSIPIVGEAFKNRSRTGSHSRFYVFIRASVLRNESFEDLKYASDVAVQGAGIDDGFPVVEPLVIR